MFLLPSGLGKEYYFNRAGDWQGRAADFFGTGCSFSSAEL